MSLPESDQTVTNLLRAVWADAAIRQFRSHTGSDYEDALGDLLCDLMHWARRTSLRFRGGVDPARGTITPSSAPRMGREPSPCGLPARLLSSYFDHV